MWKETKAERFMNWPKDTAGKRPNQNYKPRSLSGFLPRGSAFNGKLLLVPQNTATTPLSFAKLFQPL
jgi:hypothetical protein